MSRNRRPASSKKETGEEIPELDALISQKKESDIRGGPLYYEAAHYTAGLHGQRHVLWKDVQASLERSKHPWRQKIPGEREP